MNRLILVLFFSLLSIKGFSQGQLNVDVNDLYTPNSPGLILLDKAPNSVDKPTTPKAFSLSVLNLLNGGALAVTPYWLKNHPTYVADDIYKKKTPIWETFNISAATYKTDTTTSFSVGIRSQLLRIYSKKKRGEASDVERQIRNELSHGVTINTNKIDSLKGIYVNVINRPTFDIEIAGALVGTSNNGPFNNIDVSLNKSGVWLNFKWSPSKCPLDFVAVSRYSWSSYKSENTNADSSFLDYGIAMFYSKKKIDLSIEYVNRNDMSLKKNYDRIAGALNYMFSDKIVAVVSFGKNFDNVENLYALFGVKFGISKQKVGIATP
ncbi:MAG: hypothetical protein P4L41_13135 [Flavipsychrobacter sp.]|nr:hypothetical protein [Flavipsychrobacter sp.]